MGALQQNSNTMLALAALTASSTTPTFSLNNGVLMPAVAAGTWQYDADYASQSVTAALSVGFTHIDTAHDYCADGSTGDCSTKGGSNQVGIKAAIAAATRSDLFITTKVPGCGKQGVGTETCGADSVAAADKNLEELGTSYVDLLLVHFPAGESSTRTCEYMKAQWKALSDAHLATNKTRALGVSNFCQSSLECLASDADAVVPAVNQFQYHIGMGPDPTSLVSYCKEKGIVPQAYSPLGDNTTMLVNGPLVTKLGAAHNKSGVQVSLKWI